MLPVVDSLEAGLATPGRQRPNRCAKAPQVTLRQLKSALERNKVDRDQPAAGREIRSAPAPGHFDRAVPPVTQDANTVVSVLQKGYLIADRVLRPALVTVAAPK